MSEFWLLRNLRNTKHGILWKKSRVRSDESCESGSWDDDYEDDDELDDDDWQ